jgi:two-component system chemotaxis response regulator CheY
LDKPKRVLVVDDEAPIRRVLQLKLKNGGYDVILAEDGEAGLRVIESEKPDAVVTDINMPRMDGKQLCEKTNHLKLERTFLTIIKTARINPNEEQWINAMQDTVFMEKPFSPSSILERIDQYFGIKR